MYCTYVPVTTLGVFRVGWMTIMQSTCHRIRRVGSGAVFLGRSTQYEWCGCEDVKVVLPLGYQPTPPQLSRPGGQFTHIAVPLYQPQASTLLKHSYARSTSQIYKLKRHENLHHTNPRFLLHWRIPRSSSSHDKPSSTSRIVTPSCSTSRFGRSSSKKSISS